MFYIGSSSISNVEKGYNGSVSSKLYKDIWLSEQKNNKHLFRTIIISKHNTRKDALCKEEKLQRILNVVKSSMYINQSIAAVNGYFGYSHIDQKGTTVYRNRVTGECKRMKTDDPAILSGEYIHASKGRSDMKGENNPMYGKYGINNPNYGKKWNKAQKENHSRLLSGENNPMYKKPRDENPNTKIKSWQANEMINLYMTCKYKITDIAIMYNISYVTAKRIMRSGISLAKRKEIASAVRKNGK